MEGEGRGRAEYRCPGWKEIENNIKVTKWAQVHGADCMRAKKPEPNLTIWSCSALFPPVANRPPLPAYTRRLCPGRSSTSSQ